ncbi:MAG: hypothetical protein E6I32_06065 [Chloroflexi bacterium]|nr:MAG: hypothetical protein E6I32_06065 [Chloroflexota bacterium]
MAAKGLEIIAQHDRLRILDEWESLYSRLSNEFVEARERKLRSRLARKLPDYIHPKTPRAHGSRKNNLALDQGHLKEE